MKHGVVCFRIALNTKGRGLVNGSHEKKGMVEILARDKKI
jgi:hypothetical protein